MTMADTTTWIKIDRNIMRWGWYKDNNTKAVFLHLLLKANIKPNYFMGVMIQRGEVATSYNSLAEETGLTVKNARTAIEHLKSTGELAIKRHSKFSVISIVNYDLYQSQPANRTAINRQSSGNQVATIKEYKNGKNGKNIYTRARENTVDSAWEDELNVPPGLRSRFPTKQDYLNWRDGVPDEV